VVAVPAAVVAVEAAADAGNSAQLRLKQPRAPRRASAAGLFSLNSSEKRLGDSSPAKKRSGSHAFRKRTGVLRVRSPFSSRARRLPARDVRISRFAAQTLHRFGAISM